MSKPKLHATCATVQLDAEPPEWVHLMPAGAFRAIDGRAWTLKDAGAIATLARARLPLVIDYEHQSDRSAANGQPAPAAGWITDIKARADGVWGKVEWTARAAEMIGAREYRYLSPTFPHLRNGVVTGLWRAALTNNPALRQLTALATEETVMDPTTQAILEALGLPDDASEETALAAVKDLAAKAAGTDPVAVEVATAVRQKLGLASDAGIDAVAAALDAGANPDPARFVPVDTVKALAGELADLKGRFAAGEAEAAVAAAVKDGKVAPAMRDWATAYAKADLKGFVAFCAAAPVIVAPGNDTTTTGAPPAAASPALSAEEVALCAQLGVEPEAFRKAREEAAR